MKRLISVIGFLGLLACSDVSGKAEEAPIAEPVKTAVSPTLIANWTVDKAKSTLSFSSSQSGEDFTGVFANFDAVINFDPDDLTTAQVIVSIDMNSANANDAERTDALPGKEWFHVSKFPTAKFKASDFTHIGDDKYLANGRLTIREQSHPILLPFTLKIENNLGVMDGALTLNRTAYKIGTGMWAGEDWVAHKVDVKIHLEADHLQ